MNFTTGNYTHKTVKKCVEMKYCFIKAAVCIYLPDDGLHCTGNINTFSLKTESTSSALFIKDKIFKGKPISLASLCFNVFSYITLSVFHNYDL